jgi:hypothetical protein
MRRTRHSTFNVQHSTLNICSLLIVSILFATALQAQTVAVPPPAPEPRPPTPLDWTAHPADGVEMRLTREGDVNRLDFDFQGHGGYAIARSSVNLDLPPNYQFTFRLHGDAPRENLELKLLDATGENVWWLNRRDFVFPREATTIATKRRQISFAWGPAGGGEIKRVASLEIVVTAGTGGRGTIWFTDPRLDPLPVVSNEPLPFTKPVIDLGIKREIGGLMIDWRTPPPAFRLSLDGVVQKRVKSKFVWLPDTEVRTISIEGGDVRAVVVEPPTWAPTENDFLAIVARDAPRGHYPRYLVGEQPYWTIVGADRAQPEALVGEDGNVEPFKGGFCIEPFLIVDGAIITWADASITHSLADGDLPIPSVTWRARGVTMTMTAAVSESSMLQLRYRVRGPKRTTLLIAVRPFQVNPSTQFLNTPGGVARIETINYHDGRLTVNGKQVVNVLTRPARFDRGGSAAMEQANALVYPHANEVELNVPLQQGARREPFERIASTWRTKLRRVTIEIPAAPAIANTLRTNIAYILINRDGPAFQPGSRSYERAWIRDGSLIASVLLRLGFSDDAKEFAEWFAPYQFPDGKVPCCVDSRGADPVPENDSHGELIDLVAEIWRYTHDEAFVRRMWPHVDAATRYIAKLRGENHGEFEGLLTESISHEGYSARPMHSYWDDFFGVRAVEDAAELAGLLGMSDRRKELQEQAASFRRDVAASIERSMTGHHIDYVPGSAELGDFDATSTAIAVSPLELTSLLPPDGVRATFDRYLREFRSRRNAWSTGSQPVPGTDVYTPYELRNVGAFVRLGRRAEANELLDFFMRDRRPAAWNEWAEVVPRDLRAPHFLGDMPHSWVGSDFMRSVLDFFAFDREDGALVVGAGVPEKWVSGSAIHVGPLATFTGTLDLRMSGDAHRVTVELGGTAHPRGGFVVRSPYDRPIREARVNGHVTETRDGEISVRALPARIELSF